MSCYVYKNNTYTEQEVKAEILKDLLPNYTEVSNILSSIGLDLPTYIENIKVKSDEDILQDLDIFLISPGSLEYIFSEEVESKTQEELKNYLYNLANQLGEVSIGEIEMFEEIQPQIPFSEKQRMARDLGTILELKPELVSLYQQEDAEEIFNKMENCGG